MTPKEQKIINDFMRKWDIDFSAKFKRNCIQIHPKESETHFRKKCEVCWKIYQEGRPFWTETYNTNQDRRYDILDPLRMGRVEITHKGETHEDCDEEFMCDKGGLND